jgi:di/tricarboxylate transporter
VTVTVLVLLAVAIALWIVRPLGLPYSATSLLFLAALLIAGVAPATAFSGFAGGAFWTLVPALFFGHALQTTGLGTRVAYFILKPFRLTLPRLLALWVVIGLVLSLLTPSMMVRVVIATPIALRCAGLCGFGKGTRERSLVLLTAWFATLFPGFGWKTGSLTGPQLQGMFTAAGLGEIGFGDWAKVALLPILLTTVLTVAGAWLALRPRGQGRIDLPGREAFGEEYAKLGPLSRREGITGAVLLGCFAFFATSGLHGLPDAAICLAGFVVLCLAGVITTPEISTGISWDLAIFAGTAISFPAIFAATGVSDVLSRALTAAAAPVSGSPWLLLPALLLFCYLWRFADIAMFIPSMAIVVAVLPQWSAEFGISPLVFLPLLCIAQTTFFLSYTNLFFVAGERMMGEDAWAPAHARRYGLVYAGSGLVALLAAIAYWQALGLV